MKLACMRGHFLIKLCVFTVWLALVAHPVLGTGDAEESDEPPQRPVPEPLSLITDDEVDGFLFRVDEEVRSKVMELSGEPVETITIPILFGVSLGDFSDTWGESRAYGHVHTGTDIIAPYGALIVSPSHAVVTKIGYDTKGGNFVITANPGGEQFYYAHLDEAASYLSVGDVLGPGDLIGYVGNTGNARGKSPHLHLGVYYKGLPLNPFPRIGREFSREEKIAALQRVFTRQRVIFGETNGSTRFLQRFLTERSTGPRRDALASVGATGYFGPLTKAALAEYQHSVDISPASGYFGPITRASLKTLGGN